MNDYSDQNSEPPVFTAAGAVWPRVIICLSGSLALCKRTKAVVGRTAEFTELFRCAILPSRDAKERYIGLIVTVYFFKFTGFFHV